MAIAPRGLAALCVRAHELQLMKICTANFLFKKREFRVETLEVS